MIELLDFENKVISEKHQNEAQLEAKLELLIAEKEKMLKKYDLKAANSISRFDTKILNQRLLLKEMVEAQQVGIYCVKLLDETILNLNKVKNWGYSNHHMRNTYSRKSSIEKSRILVANTKIHLDKFSKELSDVYVDLKVKFQIENFDNFINIFFDNLITDWIIQRQIHNALNNVSSIKDKVNRLLANLSNDSKTAKNTIEKLDEEKKLFVVNL